MPRPKKTKVQVIEESGLSEETGVTGATQNENPDGVAPQEQEEHTETDSLNAEEPSLSKQAKQLVQWARAAVTAANIEVRKAEAALRAEERRNEERMQRWDAAERRSEPPPAYLQLERVYKSQVKGLKARLKLSEAQRAAAEAKAELSDALLIKAEYLHACSAA